ncbi:MAG: hypothetical protein LBT53_00025 [Puniceicoccales bacterium]|jgi:DNA polymerase-3 subunit delta'|nr:hypothetical protein [Puniceicoccales bacterium]
MTSDTTDILLRAFENNRLHHAILLYGPEPEPLRDACNLVAARLLGVREPADAATHPDFFCVRPGGKSRTIKVDDTRETVRQVQQTSNAGGRKVVVIFDADCMRTDSANTFLKTLEEPPSDTTIFLLTTHPASLLDTVRSRCLQFHIPPGQPVRDPAWEGWLLALDNWIVSLTEPAKNTKERIATLIFSFYGLAANFESLLAKSIEASWAVRLEELDGAGLEKEEIKAEEAGFSKDVRARRFADIALRLCAIYARQPDRAGARALHESVAQLERAATLARLNLKAPSDLEYALLRWLRVWAAR